MLKHELSNYLVPDVGIYTKEKKRYSVFRSFICCIEENQIASVLEKFSLPFLLMDEEKVDMFVVVDRPG